MTSHVLVTASGVFGTWNDEAVTDSAVALEPNVDVSVTTTLRGRPGPRFSTVTEHVTGSFGSATSPADARS